MRKSDIVAGECYIYDPSNKAMQLENGINIVRVDEPPKFFNAYIKCHPIRMSTGEEEKELKMEVIAAMLEPIHNDPRRNIVIRYPLDMPVFNKGDVEVIEALIDIVNATTMNDKPLVTSKLSATLAKVEFYADAANHLNNGLPKEGDAQNGQE